VEYVVETKGLCKYYDDVKAVDQLDLYVRRGEIYGLLGPNGAGKTTTILILLGLTEPTSGEVRVCGYNPTREPLKVKRITGYLPENVGFYDDMTARENLLYVAQLNGMHGKETEERIEEVLQEVGLAEVADQEVRTFSKGMKQRLGIADVLLKSPEFAILDEPTSGIDPEGAHQILEMIVRMNREQGLTILLSSHLLHQVQRICHRVGIISKGRLVAEGTLEELRERTMGGEEPFVFEVRLSEDVPEVLEAIKGIDGVKAVEKMGDMLRVRGLKDVRAELFRLIAQRGATILEMRGRDYTLEDIYLRYFQEG